MCSGKWPHLERVLVSVHLGPLIADWLNWLCGGFFVKATSRAVIMVLSTMVLVVANAVGVSAVSSALTGEPDHAFSSDHVHFGDDALELPELKSLSDKLGWRSTQGPGVYDVVVVGVSTSDAPTTATAANSEFVVDQADDMWDSTTNGAFRLDFRDF